MSTEFAREDYKGYRIRIVQDEDAQTPREDDNPSVRSRIW